MKTYHNIALRDLQSAKKLARRCEVLAEVKFSKDEIILFNELTNYYFDTNYPGDDYVEVDKETAENIYLQALQFQEKYESLLTAQ